MKFSTFGQKPEFEEGDVVVCATTQAGTVVQIADKLWVLLANGDFWFGPETQCDFPQDQAHLDASPREVDRFKGR